MYEPPAQVMLVDWQMPVLPGGLQVCPVVALLFDATAVVASGQHLILESPEQ